MTSRLPRGRLQDLKKKHRNRLGLGVFISPFLLSTSISTPVPHLGSFIWIFVFSPEDCFRLCVCAGEGLSRHEFPWNEFLGNYIVLHRKAVLSNTRTSSPSARCSWKRFTRSTFFFSFLISREDICHFTS